MDRVEAQQQFSQNQYVVLRGFLPPSTAELLYGYMLTRKQASVLKRISEPEKYDTLWDGKMPNEEAQVQECFSWYGDPLMDSLLMQTMDLVQDIVDCEEIIPTYSYCRLYLHGAILHKHKDRISCRYSTTICLGGDPWDITIKNQRGPNTIQMSPGDMIVYNGCDLEHWRDPFEGDKCGQVFLHYSDVSNIETNYLDGRVELGVPKQYTVENLTKELHDTAWKSNILKLYVRDE